MVRSVIIPQLTSGSVSTQRTTLEPYGSRHNSEHLRNTHIHCVNTDRNHPNPDNHRNESDG